MTALVSKKEEGLSLHHFVQRIFFPEKSIRQVKQLIESNLCAVNGKMERFSSTKLQPGDEVSIRNASVEKSSYTTLLEDEDLLIIDKPSNTESNPELFDIDYSLVHRLDKPTSGILIFSKNSDAKKKMMQAFSKREVDKEYLALVEGNFPLQKGTIEGNFGKKGYFQGNSLWGSTDKGVYARTDFLLITKSKRHSLLLVKPKTGKTHQIRAHLAEKGHPILGDYHYGGKEKRTLFIPHMMLHAKKVAFFHPTTDQKIIVHAKVPSHFIAQIERSGLFFPKKFL